MNNKIAWDDLRVVLAIFSTGTLSGAGRLLGTSHATVFRRLGSIEDRLGVQLFNRSKSGYSPTIAGEELSDAAKRIEIEVLDAERRVVGLDLRPSGTVRVTTVDSLFVGILSPIFREFLIRHAEISLEVSLSSQLFSLSRREADVAIRPTLKPDESLVGRKLGALTYAVYGKKALASQKNGTVDFQTIDWIGPDEALIYPELKAWMVKEKVDDRCRYRVDSVMGMYSAMLEGNCLSVLPRYLGDADSRLARLSKPIPELKTDLWLLTHPDLRKSARIRALFTFIADTLKSQVLTS